MTSVTTWRFDSADLGRTEEFLSRAYTKMHLSGGGERSRTRVERVAAPGICLDAAAFDFDIAHAADEPLGQVCFTLLHEGVIERSYLPDGDEGRFGAGDVFLFTPHDRPYAGVTRAARYQLVLLAPELLGRVAGQDPDGAPQVVRFTGDRPTTSQGIGQLRRVVGHVRQNILEDPVASASPLVVSAATQLVAASVLATFPHEVHGAGVADRSALPTALRRAMSHIDAHATEPLSLADIAAAAGTTGRAIQVAFRRHRGTTPMGYLRTVRLSGAHRDLVDADPDSGITVADIAARWGFAPVGRFAAYYRREYGRHPSDTLRG